MTWIVWDIEFFSGIKENALGLSTARSLVLRVSASCRRQQSPGFFQLGSSGVVGGIDECRSWLSEGRSVGKKSATEALCETSQFYERRMKRTRQK